MGRVIDVILKSGASDDAKWKVIEKITCRFKTNREMFFHQLIVSSKCEEAESLTREALLKNMSVMLGLEVDSYVDEYGWQTRTGGSVFVGLAYSELM